MFMKVRIYTI